VVTEGALGGWTPQAVWQGDLAVRHLAASPRGRYLVLVNAAHEALLFDLVEAGPGPMRIRLPSAVEDIEFCPNGTRVLFQTARWVHRASAATNGLVWLDAMLVPKPLTGARIVFGDPAASPAAAGDAFYLPVAQDGDALLPRFSFTGGTGPGLFGNPEELAAHWQSRLARTPGAEAGGGPGASPP
jgi:hypothetical protein